MSKPNKKLSATAKLRRYFTDHVGEVLNSDTLRQIAGTSEWARRVRELRQHEGMNIHTQRDDSALKPDEYRLVSLKPLPIFNATISKEIRAIVLERNGYTCNNCGVSAGDLHPFDGRKVVLHIGHIIDASKGGRSDDLSNLRALCSLCNEGSANISPVRPDLRDLLVNIKRAKGVDQVEVLKFLIKKFPTQTAEIIDAKDE